MGTGHLVRSITREERGQKRRAVYWASFDSGLLPLLEHDGGCRCRQATRKELRSELAAWLHDFLGSNATYRYTVGRLRELSGYEAALDKFPSKLRKALADVLAIASDYFESFEIDDSAKDPAKWTVAATTKGKPNYVPPKADMAERAKQKKAEKTAAEAAKQTAKKRRGGVAL